MVEKKEKRKEAEIIYTGTNIFIYKDVIDNEGVKTEFFIMSIQDDRVGFYRDEKGSLCYGKRPPKAITFSKEYLTELKKVFTVVFK